MVRDTREDPSLMELYRDFLHGMINFMHHITKTTRLLAARRGGQHEDTHSSSSTPLYDDQGGDPSMSTPPSPPSRDLDEKGAPIIPLFFSPQGVD